MNIPCEVPRDSDVWGNFAHAFKCGHRDARHAAAEHAAQADARIAELEAEVHNLNWALGTPGYEQMATPEDQAEHEVGVERVNAMLAKMEANKAAHDAMVKDAGRYRWLCDGADDGEWECFDSRWLIKHDVYGQGPSDLDAAIDAEIQRAALGPKA